jgi:hypothetical protein
MSFWRPPFDRPLATSIRLRSSSLHEYLILLFLCSLILMIDSAPVHNLRRNRENGMSRHVKFDFSTPMAQASSLLRHLPRDGDMVFTGNAASDFGDGSIGIHDDGNKNISFSLGGFFEDSDVRSILPLRSGFDIRMIYWNYNIQRDIMYVGIDCYGVCGDSDGDGDPDEPSLPFATLGGIDSSSLSNGEFFYLAIDPSAPSPLQTVNAEILIGTQGPITSQRGYSDFSIQIAHQPQPFPSYLVGESANFLRISNFTSLTRIEGSPMICGLVDPATYLAARNGNTSFGDIEFAITSFSKLPGINWNPFGPISEPNEPGYGKMSFSFISALGSITSPLQIGIDFLPNQTNGLSFGQRIVIECPWLPIDSFGACCPDEEKDFCGVCGGNNENLDPCGSCRQNASLVPASSCPAAVAQWSLIDPTINVSSSQKTPMFQVDINSDGVTDIVIGMPHLNLVLIKFYDSHGLETSMRVITNPNLNGSLDEFGFAVTQIGDVNSDGTPDIAIGAPGFNNIGIVYIILLKPTGEPLLWRTIESPTSLLPPQSSSFDTAFCSPNHIKREEHSEPGVSQPSDAPSAATGNDQPSNSPFVTPESSQMPHPSSSNPISSPNEQNFPSQDNSPDEVWPTPTPPPPFEEYPNGPQTMSPPAPDCIPSPPTTPQHPDTGPRFGASLTWVGRYIVLIGAPGAPAQNNTPLPTPFSQQGVLLLAAMSTDGNAIGLYVLSTILPNSLVSASGMDGLQIGKSELGGLVKLSGNVGSISRLAVTVRWTYNAGQTRTSLITVHIRTDGSVTKIAPIRMPDHSFPLPNMDYSPLLGNSTITPPNYVPESYNTIFSLSGTGDIDGDGNPDIVVALRPPFANNTGILLICLLNEHGVIRKTQVIGGDGVGNLRVKLPDDYTLGHAIHSTAATRIVGGINPATGSTTLLVSAINPINSHMLFYPISLRGTSVSATPGTSNPGEPSASTGPFPVNSPFGISPSSIVPPSPIYPLSPRAESDEVTVQFVNNMPILKISCVYAPNIWTQISLNRIIERASQINSSPLKTLFFPSSPTSWTKQVSDDESQTVFSARMIDINGLISSVEVQMQVITFTADKTIIFSPSSYLGVVRNTIKFSLLLRGWTFSQPKTVLDIIMDVTSNDPIISVSVETSLSSSPERYTRFSLGTTSGQTQMAIPSFASIDGILSNVSAPVFNQTSSQLILTAPPFFDTLFYDPDVSINANEGPHGQKRDNSKYKQLLFIIIPSCIGFVIIIAAVVVLGTWICRHRKAEQRWKDAGAL